MEGLAIDQPKALKPSKAPIPQPVLKYSLASPSSVAHVMYQKYVNAIPLYRQEKDWPNYGMKVHRTTLANWVIRSTEDWLMPFADRLKQELLKKDLLHADETTMQVLHEPGKKATTESYMWLFRSGADDKKPIILFNYYASRGGYHAAEYLDGFEGYLHTDGYQGYEKVKGVTCCGCWSHLRRYFVEAIPPIPSKNGELSLGEIGRDYCNKLFAIEKELAENSIRPFTIGRKNWEFANSVKGTHASATVYSIIETAKANKLNVFKYLRYLLQEIPNMDFKNKPEILDQLLPWNENIKKICK